MAKEPLSEATREFGERVRARRHQLGKSQERLAQDTRLHWSYLGQVERGQRNPTLHNILKLAEVLGVDPGDLVRGLRAPELLAAGAEISIYVDAGAVGLPPRSRFREMPSTVATNSFSFCNLIRRHV
jgi:transcriptional regulator with XRE-family HTH domain